MGRRGGGGDVSDAVHEGQLAEELVEWDLVGVGADVLRSDDVVVGSAVVGRLGDGAVDREFGAGRGGVNAYVA